MKRMTRRDFTKLAAASAAGLMLPRFAFAEESEQPGGPYPKNFMDVHKNLIAIDGAIPLIAITKDPEHFQWWMDGGVTGFAMTVGGANLGPAVADDVLKWAAEQIFTNPKLMLVRTAEDLRTAKREGKLGVFGHFQGPDALGSDPDKAWFYKALGVGVIQIAYNTRNVYANGVTERVDGGLSRLGQRLVKTCNEARVIVDVGHTGWKSAMDAIEVSSEPVIMSHCNAFGAFQNGRNAPDEVLKAIAENGGFSGAVAWPSFISTKQRPTMDDMVRMIDYMVNLMGVDHVSLGFDWDSTVHGVMPEELIKARYDGLVKSGAWDPKVYPPPPYYFPEGMERPGTLYNLTGALLARGYTEEDLGKIWGGNWLRVMEKVWGDPKANKTSGPNIEAEVHTH